MKLHFFIICFLLSHYSFSQDTSNDSTTNKLAPYSVTLTKGNGFTIDQGINSDRKGYNLIIPINENDLLQPKLLKTELKKIYYLKENKSLQTNQENLETELKIYKKFVPLNENTSKNSPRYN